MNFTFKKAGKDDIAALTQLIEEVWKVIEHSEWFAIYPEEVGEYMNDLLNRQKGTIWKAVDAVANQLAGMYIVTYPETDSDNLGYDIGLSGSELSRVAHMDTVAVHPLYRGHGLQQKLTSFVEKELFSAGFCYLMCTIHPDNSYSRHNMEACGYQVVKEVLKYGGLPRLVLLKTAARRE